jgi:4-diphosphocytidyl-2-C-methyl-D-erythritol kinase
MISEIAPAKINLTLEIINKRDDGFHEINSVMQTIDLCDLLTFHENSWIQLIPEYHNLPNMDSLTLNNDNNYLIQNLVYRSAEILKKETGYKAGAVIQLKKNIPSAAGLGGGSSDAAATLRGLNRLWKLNLSDEELAEIGAQVGSDVPFFIYGGTCYVTGRGEVVKKISAIKNKWLIIMLLPFYIEGKTAKLYSLIKPKNYSDGVCSKNLIDYIYNNGSNGNSKREVAKINEADRSLHFLFNSFEQVYNELFIDYPSWLEKFKDIDIYPIHLAGSGPAVFYICDSETEILGLVKKLSSLNEIKYYIARTVP